MTALTAATLATIAAELRTLRDALDERVADFDDVVESTRTALGLLAETWRGPLPDEVEGQVSTYIETVAGSVGATQSARDTVDAWATEAESASERLGRLQQSLADTDAAIAAAPYEAGDDTLSQDRRLISNAIADEITDWAQTCSTKGSELNSSIGTLQRCSLTEMGTVDQRSALLGDAYATGMAAWAAMHEMDLSMLDPTGSLGRVADARLADFADGAYGGLLYAVIETMKQADVAKMDGKSSRDDWLLSADPEIVRFRLEIAARAAGIELTEDQLDALTAEIITIAVFGAATDDDGRDDVDDQFDENADIEAGLDDGLPNEHDFEFPENPTDAEEYVKSWLEAQWEGDPSALDIATSLIIPDFAVMNPWSDEFSPGWALVEIAGIIPFTKVAKVASLAKLGRHGDEMAEAMTMFDESVDILTDSGRVADDVAGAGDDILSAGDDVLRSGDEVLESADEVPTSRLPRSDPDVVAEIEEVRGPVLDDLQTEVDRIWDETQDALPGASPQQLGTRAHREVEAWIDTHADELVDPDTGYRVRAEISFDDTGEVTRGTRGSIRPDVIIERQTVDEAGNATWQVVEVADLKTGRAGITTSWQSRVDDWLQPEHTTEIRPRSPVPE